MATGDEQGKGNDIEEKEGRGESCQSR